MIAPLEHPHATATFNEVSGIAYIQYQKMVSPDGTAAVYKWMMESLAQAIQANLPIRGCIFDFSLVESFYQGNITSAKAQSRNFRSANAEHIQKVPTVMIVTTEYQEVIVGLVRKKSKTDDGSANPFHRIVNTLAEAYSFIDSMNGSIPSIAPIA